MTAAFDLQVEMEEMALLLRDIRGGASELAGSSVEKLNTRRLTPDQQRNQSSSAWAKSTATRTRLFSGNQDSSADSDINSNVAESEQKVKTRAAAYSFGKRLNDNKKVVNDTPIYDINIEAVSNRKRVTYSKFGTSKRPSSLPFDKGDIKQNDNEDDTRRQQKDHLNVAIDNEDDQEDDIHTKTRPNTTDSIKKHNIGSQSKPGIAYSFPKSSREIKSRNNDNFIADLDVEKAEKKLHPHIMGTSMRTPTIVVQQDEELQEENRNLIQHTPDIEKLSNKIKTSSVVMHQDTKRSKNIAYTNRAQITPGPGDYDTALTGFSDLKGGIIYREKSKATKATVLAEINYPQTYIPGPGDYEVETADKYLRQEVRPIKFVSSALSESKMTPQLEKKRYWEEKARDARDYFDDMNEINDRLIRPRVSVSMIHSTDKKIDLKNKKILRERMAQRAEEEQGGDYNVNHSLVEKRLQSRVGMTQEMKTKKSIQNVLMERPNIAKIHAEKTMEEKNRDKFYGPNLQAIWGENSVGKGGGGVVKEGDIESGDESPTDEVLRLLGDINKKNKKPTLVSETAESYLRSSYSTGGLPLKSKVNIMREEKAPKRKLLEGGGAADYMGPQLQVDWTSQVDKGLKVRMSIDAGRDETSVMKKGYVQVKRFEDLDRGDTDSSQPGMYDISRGKGIGQNLKGVPFSLALARGEQFGPYGEKPENLNDDLADILDDGYLRKEVLDFEYGEAKDHNEMHRVRTFELHKQERHKEKPIEYPAQEKLGGTWFEGMSDQIEKQRATVQIDRMTGRDDNDRDEMILEELGVPVESGIDMDVTEYKPHMKRPINVLISDPDKNPRFEDFTKGGGKDVDAPDSISPKYFTQDKKESFVNMNKQIGRELIISGVKKDEYEEGGVEREVYGDDDKELGLQLDFDRSEGINKQYNLKYKRIADIDMSKDKRGNNDDGHMNENGDVIDDTHALDLDFEKYDNGFNKPLKNIQDWSKAGGRHDNEELSMNEEELDINVKDDTISKHKRVLSGPSWDKDERPRLGLDHSIEKDIEGSEDGRLYTEYDEKDGRPDWRDETRGNVSWSKGQERRVGASEIMKGYAELGSLIQEEELVIDPKHAAQSKYKRVQGGMDWKSSNDSKKEKDDKFLQNRDLGISNEEASGILVLDVDDTFKQNRVLGGHHIGPTGYLGGGVSIIQGKDPESQGLHGVAGNSLDGDKLDLKVDDTFRMKSIMGGSPMGNLSFREGGISLNTVHDELIRKGDIPRKGPQELSLEVNDEFRLSKVPGGSPMGYSTQPVKNTAENNYNEYTRKSPVKKKKNVKKENMIERKPVDLSDIFNMKGRNENIENNKISIPIRNGSQEISDSIKAKTLDTTNESMNNGRSSAIDFTSTKNGGDNMDDKNLKNRTANRVSFEFVESKNNENQPLKKNPDKLSKKKISSTISSNNDNNKNKGISKNSSNETKGNKSVSSSSIMNGVRDAIKKNATPAAPSNKSSGDDISRINANASRSGTAVNATTSNRKHTQNTENKDALSQPISQPNEPMTPPKLFSPPVKPRTFSPNKIDMLDAQVRAISLGK